MDRTTEEAIIARAQSGDRRAVDELVTYHLRYVRTFARKMGHYGVPLDDLVAEGSIGLLEALPLYDSGRGVRFLTFAGHRIRMHVYRAVFEHASKGMAGRGSAWGRMFFRLSRQLCQAEAAEDGADPHAVVAEAQNRYGLNVTPDQVQQIVAMQRGPLSLERDSETGSLRDTLTAGLELPDEIAEANERQASDRAITLTALEGLDTREIAIVALYDLHDEKTSLQEAASVLGLGKETVRGVRITALGKIRKTMRREHRIAHIKQRILRVLSRRPLSGWALRRAIGCDHTLVAAAVRRLFQDGAICRRPGSKIMLTKHDTYARSVDFSEGQIGDGKAY